MRLSLNVRYDKVNKKKLNRGCFTETVYVEAWCDMQIH